MFENWWETEAEMLAWVEAEQAEIDGHVDWGQLARSERPGAADVEGSLARLKADLAALEMVEHRAASALGRCREIDAHRRDGHSSPTAMVKHLGRMGGGRARRLVTLARMSSEAPRTTRSWATGVVSTDQVMVLAAAQAESPEQFSVDEAWLVATLAPLGVADTRRAVDYWRQASQDPPDPQTPAGHERRFCHVSRTLDGTVRGDFLLDAEAGDLFLAALDAATPVPAEEDPRTPAQRRADGLADLAAAALAGGHHRPSQPQVMVHVDLPTLVDRVAGLSETTSGEVLSPETLRRVACDAALRRLVWGPDGLPVDLGRRTRTVPAWLREAVVARDRRCIWPGCDRPPRWCDCHHITHWADGGHTSVDDLALVCRFHHTCVHEGGFRMVGTATDLTIYRPDGTVLHRRTLPPGRSPP